MKIIHWRVVPVNSDAVGEVARSREPLIKQVFIVENPNGTNNELRNLNFKKRVSLSIPYSLIKLKNFFCVGLVFPSKKTCNTYG